MAHVKHKVLVLSGKGGVGKSTFAAQLAFALAAAGNEVGLLDIDICGPSVPKMLGLEGHTVHQSNAGWSPVYVEDNLAVMSIGFMLPNPDEAVIWRGPRKNGLIKQFLKDVVWGELDYLVVDAPPGTSDEHITIAQCLNASTDVDGAVIVTTPQEVAIIDVRKEVNFCRKVGLRILGVVENMAGLQVPCSAVRFMAAAASQAPQPLTSSQGHMDVDPPDAHTAPHALQTPMPAAVTAPDAAHSRGATAGSAAQPLAAQQGPPVDVTAQVMAVLAAHLPHLGPLSIHAEVFKSEGGGAARMCRDMGIALLGRVPLDPALTHAAESGLSIFEAAAMAQGTGMPSTGSAGAGQSLADTGCQAAARAPVCVPALQGIVAALTSVLTGPPS